MSEVSFFRRHRDLIWAFIIALFLSILPLFPFVEPVEIPLILPGSVFIAVMTSIGAFMIIFRKYSSVISKAKEKEMISLINKVFFYPAISAVIGLIYIVFINSIEINTVELFSPFISEILITGQRFLLYFFISYSILSLLEGFWFVYRIVIGES